MEITMARGDLEIRTFQIRSPSGSGTVPYTDELDEIYLTVKRKYTDTNYVIQKRLSDGGIIYQGDGIYGFTIHPADTDKLDFGGYDFDIELIKNGEIKKTFNGRLNLTREVTYAANEVVS